ncbi:Pentatricopeptide repeat-containing protein [Drosera capensis]
MARNVAIKWTKKLTADQVEHLIRAEKDIQKALTLFDSATAEYSNGFRHDQKTFGLMISRLISANQFRPAEDILHRMHDEDCDITEDVFLTICRAYGRVHKPLDAVRIFKKMSELKCNVSEKSYITVLAILVAENQLKMAMRFYRYMRGMGIQASVVSLNVLIKALCMNKGTLDNALKIFREMPNRGCPPDSYTYGTLISGLFKYQRIDEANDLFKEMEKNCCSPSVVTYTSLINCLCQSGKLDEALEMFKAMASNGVKPNVFTYSVLMDGLCKSGCSSQALSLLDLMIRSRLSPNMITYSTLIGGLCKEGKLMEAVELFDRMKLQGLKPDAGLYWKIIGGFCEKGKFQEAANFLDEMILGGVSPNRLTWNLLVKSHNAVAQGLCIEGDVKRPFHLYLSMRTRGISIEPITYSKLIKCFCDKGDRLKVCRIVDDMAADGCVPVEDSWKEILLRFWNGREVFDTAELLKVLDLRP